MNNLLNNEYPEIKELNFEEIGAVSGGWAWLLEGIAGYIAGEVLDGVLRYASGERSR
ncbi:hypothetical protein [Spirosoma panaciterrae]|uniref:hypothetical protein n=1 Tax=Spirosoma panaciterrae TaxID=496058 RepID=UPI00037F2ECF|nr:hypothetical protein [Spirosoma panaciterrae]